MSKTIWTCGDCHQNFDNNEAFRKHRSRNKSAIESGKPSCAQKLQLRIQKRQIDNMNKEDIVNVMNEASKTNEILEQLKKQTQLNERLQQKVDNLDSKMSGIEEQNREMKDMMLEFNRNPQLVILCEKLYPLSSLRQINLQEPPFKPVMEILDRELPEYANLINTQTAKVHCKAVNKFNEIQPTAVQDGDAVFYKNGQILAKDTVDCATKEFINCFSLNGYHYAQKAYKDLESTRPSDRQFQTDVLKSAKQGAFPKFQDM